MLRFEHSLPPTATLTRGDRDSFTDSELRTTFPSADWVEGLIVFNIGGNRYRLIAAIHFNRKRVYIRYVLTHEEYDQGAWRP